MNVLYWAKALPSNPQQPLSPSFLQVEFSADTLRLNLIDLARTGSKLIAVTGRLEYACTAVDSADPVTFTTRDAHLVRYSCEMFQGSSVYETSVFGTFE